MTTPPIPIKGPRLNHDGPLALAEGRSAKSKQWKTNEVYWSTLLSRLREPTRTPESVAEYHGSPKSAQDAAKDVGGYLKGPAKGGRRRAGTVERLYLVALDIDDPEPDFLDRLRASKPFAWAVHSTHSHRPDRPRLRLVAPLKRPVSGDEWQAIARRIAADLGLDQFDPTTFELERLNYWPSIPRDAEYVFEALDAAWLEPEAVLARYDDWRDPSQWPSPPREGAARKRMAEKAEDPEAKRGIVGAFCRTYTIDSAIETFLEEAYEPHQVEGRYTYRHGSTAGGLILYDGGKFAYSHHGTDPVGGRLVNAFDLVRIHLFGSRDEDAAPGTPVVKSPSYLAMVELASGDEAVRERIAAERLDLAMLDFGPGDDEVIDDDGEPKAPAEPLDTAWAAKLETGEDGAFKTTRHNILIILENDPLLKGRIWLNEFTGRVDVRGDLPWREKGDHSLWRDRDDSGLRYYLEHIYEIDNAAKAHDSVNAHVEKNAYHPVRDYLRSLEWDGIPRIDSLFVDYLGAEDSAYVRAVSRKALTAAVARVMRPGCKFDYMPVLVGRQGFGKSYFLGRLGRSWFSDSLTTVQGKEAYEALQGAWIIEMGELAALRRSEVESIKHFLTKREDIYRAAYGRHVTAYPRQCVFFGTTNEESSFLKDATGNRRYWPVKIEHSEPSLSIWKDLTDSEVDQIWAEAVEAYDAGEELFLPRDIEAAAREVQAQYTEESDIAGAVRAFLARDVPKGWQEMDLDARRAWSDFDDGEAGEREPRSIVCVAEVWVEALGGDLRNLPPHRSREIGEIIRTTPGWAPRKESQGRAYFAEPYGRQRAFERTL